MSTEMFLLLSVIFDAGVPINGGGAVVAGVVGQNSLVLGKGTPGDVLAGGAGEVLSKDRVEAAECDVFARGKIFVFNHVIDGELVARGEGIGESDPLTVT